METTTLTPQELRENAAMRLAHGRLIVTAVSAKTGDHITLRFRCKNRELKQKYVSLAEAKIIGVEAGRVREDDGWQMADMVGWCFADEVRERRRLSFKPNRDADSARVWLATHLLLWIKGAVELHPDLESVKLADRCARCSREISDPESIERGVGPECWGKVTNSHHQVKLGGVSSTQTHMTF